MMGNGYVTALTRLREARTALKAQGRNDLKTAEQIADLIERSQKLIEEMNAAKVAAMREAEKPFLAELEELDKEMSVLITIFS